MERIESFSLHKEQRLDQITYEQLFPDEAPTAKILDQLQEQHPDLPLSTLLAKAREQAKAAQSTPNTQGEAQP